VEFGSWVAGGRKEDERVIYLPRFSGLAVYRFDRDCFWHLEFKLKCSIDGKEELREPEVWIGDGDIVCYLVIL
jgi:hypothetical protein